MTSIPPLVPDAVIAEAIAEGLAAHGARGSAEQWQAVQTYLDQRHDRWPSRTTMIGELTGTAPHDLDDALAIASAAIRGDQTLRAAALTWLAEDIADAAPLMGAFTSHDTSIEHAVVQVDDAQLAPLAQWLTGALGEACAITAATVIGGGFSRRMWRVGLRTPSGERRVIVRIEQGGMFGTDTVSEVHAMRALHAAGFAVPEVIAVDETGAVLGEPCFVMAEVPGVVRVDEEGLADIIRSVAALHRVPVTALDASGRSAERVISDNIEGWRAAYRAWAPQIPLIEHAADWLHAHLRPTGPSVIVHGDTGPGNALFDPDRGLTTIDWEFAHVGDAAEDWAYLAIIRGRRIMDAASWQARIREFADVDLTADQWRMWLAYNHFRGACVNLSARRVFERGPMRTADQLAIGVAVHLRFLGQLTEITCA